MDGIDLLECVYYPGPIPKDGAVLTTLCFLFDKIYFPNVYLPKGDYDKDLLKQEIERIQSIGKHSYDDLLLIGVLKFLAIRPDFDGILEYPTDPASIFGSHDKQEQQLAHKIYNISFPPRENWEPIFDTRSSKGLPESRESVMYAGSFHYQAGAILYAARNELPLVNDGSWLPLPFHAEYKNRAKELATLIALESMELVLPDLPLLTTQELVDFRIENAKELHAFRSGMLRYAGQVNNQISDDMPVDEIARKIKFFVETNILPALHDLNRDLQNPNRAWYKRTGDVVKISASAFIGYVTGGLVGKTAAEAIRDVMVGEVEGLGAKRESAARNPLYYLVKAQAISR